MVKMLVYGGRHLRNSDAVSAVLDWAENGHLGEVSFIVKDENEQTCLPVSQWVARREIQSLTYGRLVDANGPHMNDLILRDHPDIAFAVVFPGDGTVRDMVQKLMIARIPTWIVHPEDPEDPCDGY